MGARRSFALDQSLAVLATFDDFLVSSQAAYATIARTLHAVDAYWRQPSTRFHRCPDRHNWRSNHGHIDGGKSAHLSLL